MNTSKIAILVSGTYREIEFLLNVFPQIMQGVEHDIYVVLRHTSNEISRLGTKEVDFKLPPHADNVFMCELPSIDKVETKSRYLIPVGPTDENRECAILSMFQGVFTAIQMMKASLRKYDYVMKTRTDYLPPMTIPEMMKEDKIIVDGCANWYRRYPDRFDILWQGSLNDIFCFATTEQFLKLWDFEDILKSVWTGIPETTLFRAAMKRFLGDDMQSPRRNENFLKKYFVWDENDTKQSFHVMRRRHSLPKPDEATYFKGDEVIKYFVDKKRVSGKVERAKLLEGFVPPVRKVSDNFFTYKYVEGDLLSDCDSITFARFLEFMKSFWQPIEVKDFPWTCLEFYQNKTFQRLDLMREKVNIHTCVINGVEVPPIYVATEKLGWNWLSEGKAVRFHGDPQLENVIVTPEGFSLIDWREDFGGVKEYGDIYYDLAKIYHALIVNGEVIRSGGYSITEGDTVEYTLETKENLREFKEMMERFILDNGYDLKKVKTLSALIYLNSAPLHEEPYNRFLYYFGRKMLREVR